MVWYGMGADGLEVGFTVYGSIVSYGLDTLAFRYFSIAQALSAPRASAYTRWPTRTSLLYHWQVPGQACITGLFGYMLRRRAGGQ